MEDDRIIFDSGRRPQIFENSRRPKFLVNGRKNYFFQMKDNLNFLFYEGHLHFFLKLEYGLNSFFQMEEDLKENNATKNRKRVNKMVVAPLRVT